MFEFLNGISNFFSTLWGWIATFFDGIGYVFGRVGSFLSSFSSVLPASVFTIVSVLIVLWIIFKIVGR